MATSIIYAQDGAHGNSSTAAYDQWRASTGMLAGRHTNGWEYRAAWVFKAPDATVKAQNISTITFRVNRTSGSSSGVIGLRCGGRSSNFVSSVNWATADDFYFDQSNIGLGWMDYDLSPYISTIMNYTTTHIIIMLKQPAGTAVNFSSWEWSSTSPGNRAHLIFESSETATWRKVNGVWVKLIPWKNVSGTWYKYNSWKKSNGVWIKC